jgi:hypothetical protein
MTEPYPFPDQLGKKFRNDWSETNIFERDGKLQTLFNHPDLYEPHEASKVIQEQKANLRSDRLHLYSDDLAIPAGEKVHHLVRITRSGGGIPKVDPEGPRPQPILLEQHGMHPLAQEVFTLARKTSLKSLTNQLNAIMKTEGYKGYTINDLDDIYRDSWLQVSRAVRALGPGSNRLVDSDSTVSSDYREQLRKYIYTKALLKLEAPISETGLDEEYPDGIINKEDIGFGHLENKIGWGKMFADTTLPIDSEESNFWGISANEIVQELFLDSNWLVNMPGRPGQQRFVPKNIPFGYATDMNSTDIEHYLNLWNEFGLDTAVGTYNKYLNTIKGDTGSNIQIYTDISRTGGGISYFARNINTGAIDEIKDTMMTWQEFGDFIALEAKFNFMLDLGEWFKQQDEWFEGIPILNLTNKLDAVEWMKKSRIMKLLDVIKTDEDKIFRQGGKKSWRQNRSLTSPDHIDEGSIGSLFLNKFGTHRDGSENMDELASWWLMSPVLRGAISTAKWFGLSPEEWRNEINWIQAFFGDKTEIGQLGREAAHEFLISINKEFPDDITKMTEDDFDRIRNEEMRKYVLTRADYFDRVRSKVTIFGRWAGEIADTYRRETYTPRTGTGRRANPNAPKSSKKIKKDAPVPKATYEWLSPARHSAKK